MEEIDIEDFVIKPPVKFSEYPNSGKEPTFTCGKYPDELISGKHFDEAVEKTGLFKIWGKGTSKGIAGEMIHPLPNMIFRPKYYIDRILEPTSKLRDAGWTKGLIGVELKKSGIKVGQPLSQMLDYLRCVWFSPDNHMSVLIDYCFLWPLEKCGGVTASIMAQNRVGGVCLKYPPDNEWHNLQFNLGEQFVLQYFYNKQLTEVKNLNIGARTGAR